MLYHAQGNRNFFLHGVTEQNTNQTKSNSNESLSALTQERATESNAIQIPSISLPKGGGALKGIDEKFEVNAVNGTAGFSVPLPISPGRNGFSPSLALSYNSGGGNSPYGLGWSVGYPSIQRKTDKKLPIYRDGIEDDTFMFSGAEDLVPYLEEDNGSWKEKEYPNNGNDGYKVKRYRPRIEGGFTRIEKITHVSQDVAINSIDTYWKVTTGDNVATIFGRSALTRIADPQDPTRIFEWLPEFSYDDKGNWIKYEYKEENLDNVPKTLNEKNRLNGVALFTNQYLKRIRYGNKKAYYAQTDKPYDPQTPTDDNHFFELVMDYGEHTNKIEPHQEVDDWDYREDAFSSYRSGFEIRTNRLCKRVLMFHHFKGEDQFVGTPDEVEFDINYLVRSLDLFYKRSSINESGQAEVNYLNSIIQSGHIRKPGGEYSNKSLPPMEFTYEKLNWNKNIKTVSKDAIINAPVGLTNNYQWVDLYGEGISGILTEQGEGWYYKSNLGDVDKDGEVAFTTAQIVAPKPSFTGLSNGTLSIQDLEANGKKHLVVNSPSLKGYFEMTHDNDWKPFRSFEQLANIDFQDPNTRMFDLNGDGQPELVMTEENVFVWYAADGKRGHLPAEFAHKTFDEEKGPAIVFADQEQTIFLADMCGDGLTDIARIRNGEICYWANKGYGNFSAKISMADAPLFDHPDLFNPQYLHLADVSATGATDIIYLGDNEFKAYINLSGNAWSEAHEIDPFPHMDSNARLSVIDLLGTGTSCIVWSSDLPAYANAPMRYIDLMNSKKPHVMTKQVNNMGMETSLEYKSSTYYYLKDKLAGKPWITKLPFPVQVISKQIVKEKITDVRFTTEYKYHHGYFDHPEREFRGFGMVEQIDTEFYETWKVNNEGNALDPSGELYQPQMLTKTWFHTGAFFDRERILNQFKEDYWFEEYNRLFADEPLTITEPGLIDARLQLSTTIQDPDLLEKLSADEWREALRACKGMMLRQEVFAMDAPKNPTSEALKLQAKPYTVATHNCNIQLVQPRDKNEFGVFIVTESEAISISYERDETDYRLSHTLNTKIDELGNVLESAAVVYGRNPGKAEVNFDVLSENLTDFSEDVLEGNGAQKTQLLNAFNTNIEATKKEQLKTHIVYSQNSFAKYKPATVEFDDIDLPDAYRLRLPFEAKTFEITGLNPADDLFQLSEFGNTLADASEIEYHIAPTGGTEKRLIEHVKSKYLKDDLTSLEFGLFDTIGLPFEAYQLAYTPNLITDIYSKDLVELEVDNQVVNDFIETKGKYSNLNLDGKMWIRSGITHFKDDGENIDQVKQRFYSPLVFEDPFEVKTSVVYDTESFETNGERKNDGYYLFIKETIDELDNKSQIDIFNYRVLSPTRMIDINANPSSVLVDELGLVKAVAAEGNGTYVDDVLKTEVQIAVEDKADNLNGLKEFEDNEGADAAAMAQLVSTSTFNNTDTDQLRVLGNDLLKGASARFIYDFEAFKISGSKPTVVASIIREKHFAKDNNSPIQFSFEYSDGGGNVVMAKTQAEPGMAFFMENGVKNEKDTTPELRWIGNGRTVLNNKGNPIKQYEPYFSTNFGYEDAPDLVEIGVSPILYYDSIGRLIKTKLPDGTLTRVEFDSWKQLSFDQNDSVLESQWYLDRGSPDPSTENEPLNNKERRAAWLAAKHANTPSSVYLDSLGRPVLSIEHNGKDQQAPNKKDRLYSTFINLDIEGNTQAVIDARGNAVMAYKQDMLGHLVYQDSMDAGESWQFNNLMGNPVHSWDSNDQLFTTEYDDFQRPVSSFIQKSGELPQCIGKVTYGEEVPDATLKNLRGQIFQTFDSSGVIHNERIDFKGNPLENKRQLAAAFDVEIVDWDNPLTSGLEVEIFTTNTEYDAIGRMTRHYNWHRNVDHIAVIEPKYNERGVLVSEDHITAAEKPINDQAGGKRVTAVLNIKYDAKGQRMQMRYANGTTTKYHYDPLTFRLIQLRTTKDIVNPSIPTAPTILIDENVLQNLYYSYDPVGNITEIEDDAFKSIFFNNAEVKPINKYTYDAIYRLIKAESRENSGFNFAPTAKEPDIPKITFPATDQTLRNYTQHYAYDPVGNFLLMKHITNIDTERWTRRYEYDTDNNRLLKTWTGNDLSTAINYLYDEHGSMLNYNNAAEEFRPKWDYINRLHKVELGGGGTAFYQYNSGLERSRKRVLDGNIIKERLYLGGMEVYRRWNGTTLQEEIETHHLFVDDQRVLIVEDILLSNHNQLPTTTLYKYQYSNHLGSVGLEMDENANIISYEEYHPYGTIAYQAKNTAIKTTAKRYRYTGMERDKESGLNYHSARYYLPWLGRWLSSDPFGIGDGVNLYGYSRNNPIRLSDPGGTQSAQTKLWKPGPRGERIPINGYRGPLRPINNYTKPIARGHAERGNFEAAELAEFNMCATCHVLTKVDPSDFYLEGYIDSYQDNYKVGQAGFLILTAPITVPAIASIGGISSAKIAGYGLIAETTADVGQALLATWDVIQNRNVQNVSAAGYAWGDVASGPGWGAETATASRKLRNTSGSGDSNGTNKNTPVVPDVFLHEIIPIRNTTRRGEKRQPVAPKEGTYRGVTKKNREEAQRIGEKYGGPGDYDVGHRTPLSQVAPGEPVRFRAERSSKNSADGNAIAKTNKKRRKAGLYVRPTIPRKKKKKKGK